MIQDIYLDENYGKLYEKMEHGISVTWKYDGPEGKIEHMFIVREIPGTEGWHDLITPYGYGGPVIQSVNEGFDKGQLVDAFYREFGQYCAVHKIVSEFVRFHPMINNGSDFSSVYHSEFDRYTVGTNLKEYGDPLAEEFTKGCRKNIKQSVQKGVRWRVTPRPDKIDGFKAIYYSTMDRNHASGYYYFDDEYFKDCQRYFHDHLLFVEAVYQEKTIAAGLYFMYGKTIHIHLSGTLSEYLDLSPAYVLRYAVMLWAKENGYEMIHHGGGRSNVADDSLYLFKKQFGKNTKFPFYVGRKVWNEEMYDKLCKAYGVCTDDRGYFPAYRGGKILDAR